MSLNNFKVRTPVLFLFIFAIAMLRVAINIIDPVSLIANFSPLGAMAIFSGAYFDRRAKAIVFPILMMLLSDLILQQTVFKNIGNGILYSGWYWVYGSFALMAIAGRVILKTISISRCLLAVFICVLIHWVISDLGVWIGSKMYAQNLGGFFSCLINAIPFEWRFICGTLVYGTILFGLFESMQRKHPALQLNRI